MMEANANGGIHGFLNGSEKKGLEWDLNDWRWDGDLFIATPVNAVPFDCRDKQLVPVPASGGLSIGSTSCSDNTNESDHRRNEKGKGELEKRRKVIAMEDDEPNVETDSLALKLGGNDNNGRKVQAGGSNRGICQVDGCGADLRRAKDYHRRHKVCEMHAKASKAPVGNVIQRFCQQCSRFHLLEKFDEGKRSCRRRLAGHNRRRRKSPVDAAVSDSPLMDDQFSSFLLTSLLMILSNLQTKNNEQLKDQDLLSHFLRNLANSAGTFDSRNLSALLQASQDPKRLGNPAGISSEAAQAFHSNDIAAQESFRTSFPRSGTNCDIEVRNSARKPANKSISAAQPAIELPRKSILECSPESAMGRIEPMMERVGLKNFDLNDVYNDEDDIEETEKSRNPGTTSLNHSWMLQESHHSSNPSQSPSGNSDSASIQSLISCNGDSQGRTDRIIFKLFGKDPKDFPLFLRAQILAWLSNTPTDMESYIKPGCIILTVYLQLPESAWEELCHNLSSNLKRLLDLDGSDFWRTGWMYVRVRHQMVFVYNGQLVLDSPLLGVNNNCAIFSVTPIAVSISATVKFTIKGFNVAWSSMRFLSAFEGKYLVQETAPALVPSTHNGDLNGGPQIFSFSCSLPNAIGRGFVEVEDHGLGGAFFPFIVAEPEVCSEIRMLEDIIDAEKNILEKAAGVAARAQALDFLHEMGWLLHRCQLRSKSLEDIRPNSNVFPLKRFKWLMEFSMKHDWLAVVRKLLDILVGGVVDLGGCPIELALEEMSLLHDAVRKNSRTIVELLLCYIADDHLGNKESKSAQIRRGSISFLFRPDMIDTEHQTPLHIAACQGDAEAVLDGLTDDPLQVGIAAWKSAHDSAGLTPEDHARSNGYEAYLRLVERKINQKSNGSHVVLDIPETSAALHGTEKQEDGENCSKPTAFEIDKRKSRLGRRSYCNVCSHQQLAYIKRKRSTLLYKPAVLSMVGIAAVCVSVGLLLKGLPEVHYVHSPFRWEVIFYGSM